MIEIFALAFLFVGLLGMLKEWRIDAPGYGDALAYDRPSYGIPGYQDDEQIRQFHRRERAKDRHAEESRWYR